MRYIIPILILLLLGACQADTATEADVIPTDLVGKRAYLKEKKAEFRELTRTIDKLESEINELSPPSEKAKKLVTTTNIDLKDFKRFVEVQGVVESDDIVSVTSEVGGRIIVYRVKEGQYVKKGQLLAKVDLEQIDKQEAELSKSLELAVELYERQSRLWKQNIGSEVQYLQAKNNKERIEKTMETMRFQKRKANVYAPISGVVDKEFLKLGDLAAPGMPIVQIINTKKVKVVANVPESYLGKVKSGEKVTIKFPALDQTTTARVSQLGRTINPANRTFEVEVELPNKSGVLKPNLLSLMLINDFSTTNSVVIPIDLVQQEVSGKQFVYTVVEDPDGPVAKKTYVEIGESYEGEVVITNGLTGSETLITKGARNLSDGEFLEISAKTQPQMTDSNSKLTNR